MPVIRATFFFTDGKYGWQENYWNAGGAGATLEQTYGYAASLWIARVNMLASPCQMTRCRVSDDAVRGDAIIADPTIDGGTPIILTPGKGPLSRSPGIQKLDLDTGPAAMFNVIPSTIVSLAGPLADNPYSVVKMRWDALDHSCHSIRPLGGVPDALVLDQVLGTGAVGGALGIGAAGKQFNDAYASFQRNLLAFWGFRSLDKTQPMANITAVAVDPASGLVKVTLDTDLGLTCNSRILLSGICVAPGSRKLTGPWSIITQPPGIPPTISILLKGSLGPVVYLGGGKVQKVAYVVTKIGSIKISGPMRRMRGKPWDSPKATPKKRGFTRQTVR